MEQIKTRNGFYQIHERKISISIKKDASALIYDFKQRHENEIKYFNEYDNDTLMFFQIYLSRALTLNDFIELKEIGLDASNILISQL